MEPALPMQEPSEEGPETGVSSSRLADSVTAMTPRFGLLARLFGRRFFAGFRLGPGDASQLRELETRGAVVYVMRYSSRIDYFLFNWLFVSEGIRLSAVANGIRFYYYRPLGEALRMWGAQIAGRLRLGLRGQRERQIEQTRQVLREGGSLFLFLRTAKIGQRLRTRRGAVASGRSELDYVREVVDTCFAEPIAVVLVPLAVFWQRGARRARRFLNVFYGAPGRPSDIGKLISFLWNYRNLTVRIGTPIDLRAFVDERRIQGCERVSKQVRRSLMIFLRREEKPVVGSAFRVYEKIEEAVMADPDVQRAIDEAVGGKRRRLRVEARARRQLREIAARPSPTMLAFLDWIVGWMTDRLFGRVEVYGLERIVATAKLHPLVLVPNHRSHFDYLVLSWLFYERHLVPPHVAAGINLAFWPLGPILRRAGGFFLRRSFAGDRLYSAVFRSYVGLLIKDGATQEFFIEGTRSRTGKTLVPRLGMLGMIVDVFALGVRRDLCLVPVAFTYERLVEESSMVEQRRGAKKKRESLLGLLRSRRIFRHGFGSMTVRFGEPISLAEELRADGPLGPSDGVEREELRPLTERLGNELCRRINGLVTAGGSAVACSALLATPGRGLREEEFKARIQETVGFLRLLQVPLAESVEQADRAGQPEAVLDLLLQSRLVERRSTRTGNLIHHSGDVRDRLDYYRAALVPTLVWPGVLGLVLPAGGRRGELVRAADLWLELLRLEYFPPERQQERHAILERVLDHLLERGWVSAAGSGELSLSSVGCARLPLQVAQIQPVMEAYGALFDALEALEGVGARKTLIEAAGSVLQDQLLVGEARFPEALSPVTFGNALMLLLQEDILCMPGSPTESGGRYERGPRWAELAALRERMAGALRSR